MNLILWIMQVLLSAFFIMPGWGKINGSKERHIADKHLNPEDSIIPIRILGILEWLGCIGIILPWLINITPVLTPVTAVGFCIIMLAGMTVHTKRKEYKMLPMLIAVFAMSATVAFFRFRMLNIL